MQNLLWNTSVMSTLSGKLKAIIELYVYVCIQTAKPMLYILKG